jgi:amidase
MLPAFLSSADIAAGQLASAPPAWNGAAAALRFVYPSSCHLSPRVRAFADVVAASFPGGKLLRVLSIGTCAARLLTEIVRARPFPSLKDLPMAALWTLDATALSEKIRKKEISVTEAVKAHLDRMHAVNPKLNAVVRDLSDIALKEAAEGDAMIRRGDQMGIFHGLPITTKVNTDQRGLPTDNGVIPAKDLIAEEDNPCIANLRRAGVVVIGRTNTPAFSMRMVTDNALHGQTWNPWGKQSTCGGSSGGAGAALAAGIGVMAQGNDIGGSIRFPAYCNGVVGLRPTPGRIPSYNGTASKTGHRAFATQLMSVQGPLARSVRDVTQMFAIMTHGDPRDPMWAPVPPSGPAPAKLKAALVIEPDLHPLAADAVRRAGALLKEAQFEVVEASPPGIRRLTELWMEIGVSEMGSTLLPYVDKIGDKNMEKFFKDLWETRGHRDLERYQAALRERDSLIREWQTFLADTPVVVMPSTSEHFLAPDCDLQGPAASDKLMFSHRFQLAIAVLGLPALALPMGEREGLPTGVQIVAQRYREDLCLVTGLNIERRQPPMTPIDPRF